MANWDTITPAPGPRKPITEGIRVGTIRSDQSQAMILKCGHRNTELREDETGKYYVCTFGHREYITKTEEPSEQGV